MVAESSGTHASLLYAPVPGAQSGVLAFDAAPDEGGVHH